MGHRQCAIWDRDSQWDIPPKRALFTSDGLDSTTSGSDIPESHADRPPEVEYLERLISGKRQDEGGTERLCSPNMELEMAVIQLQRDVDDCRTELELARKHTPAVTLRPHRRSGFTSTPVPRYSGKSNWEQYHEVFEAIVRSNGWDDVTAAQQLLSHLDGDALNVALLVPESRIVVPGFLIKSLSDHYNAPGRLAEYKCGGMRHKWRTQLIHCSRAMFGHLLLHQYVYPEMVHLYHEHHSTARTRQTVHEGRTTCLYASFPALCMQMLT